ncbi:hypothetical protein BDY21DRAFT_342714 [Lineolata rhizophorae]|uniref:Uncharacterized protein n=1 Tax=Lineolata rhizophorae TaxID=578093 RepID=A0A6A6P203_9PEZI|nr:hypothetical protein BDY21DRAFT_342714 [Lineolata rhizophorae]
MDGIDWAGWLGMEKRDCVRDGEWVRAGLGRASLGTSCWFSLLLFAPLCGVDCVE